MLRDILHPPVYRFEFCIGCCNSYSQVPVQGVLNPPKISDAKGGEWSLPLAVRSSCVSVFKHCAVSELGESIQIAVLFSAGFVLCSFCLCSNMNLFLGTGQQERRVEVEEQESPFSAAAKI